MNHEEIRIRSIREEDFDFDFEEHERIKRNSIKALEEKNELQKNEEGTQKK